MSFIIVTALGGKRFMVNPSNIETAVAVDSGGGSTSTELRFASGLELDVLESLEEIRKLTDTKSKWSARGRAEGKKDFD